MKKIGFTLMGISLTFAIAAQQNQGTVLYTRTMQMPLSINDNDPAAQMLPKSRDDKFELIYANNQSIWKHVEEEDNSDDLSGNGMQIKMIGPGQNDIIFCDFNSGKKTEQRDMMERKFIISDSIHKLEWKLSDETKNILGHVCRKAIAQRIGKRTQMTMDNGKIERKEIADTANIVVWFTADIPVSAGPEVQGQLPGLILALDINNGRMVYKAVELSSKADVGIVKEPSKGKKVTPGEYVKETAKMVDEMQKNNQGQGNRRMVHMN